MAAAGLREGAIFAERYRIIRELASGGMGAVYEAVHTVTERRCAVKVMLSHVIDREILRKRFLQESRLAAQIGSEYIVDVLDAGVDEETRAPFLVMELLAGEDLAQRVVRLGGLPPAEAVMCLWHAALALDRTHQAGIVHRDLKASNLFLTRREDGSPLVKVLDFGVAKVLDLEAGLEQRTQTVGTPIYMAPEQFRANGRLSPQTDIYALGMLAYTLLVGLHYWRDEHQACENAFAFASLAAGGPKDPPCIRAAREGVTLPAGFDAWFAQATARWPQDRFTSATQAVLGLTQALGVELPLASRPTSLFPPTPAEGMEPPRSSAAAAETVESGARVARPPSRSDVSVPVVESKSGQVARAERTGISLSVTSGGLPLDAKTGGAPRKGRSGAALLLVAMLASLAALVVLRPWRALTTAVRVIEQPAVTAPKKAAATEPSAIPAPPPPPAEPKARNIAELPYAAPTEPSVESRPVPVSRRRFVSGSRSQPEEDRSSTATPTVQPPVSPAATRPDPPKPASQTPRDHLWGRN